MSDQFHLFAQAVEKRFRAIATDELYEVNVEDLFGDYLGAFPAGTNEIFRERTEHDCSCCKNFIRNLGLVVAIRDGQKQTVWDGMEGLPFPYNEVAAALRQRVVEAPISAIYRTSERKYGAESTIEYRDGNHTHRWYHFWAAVPAKYVSANPDQLRGTINTNFGVFKRGVEELTLDAMDTVLDLIDERDLYRGAEFRQNVVNFRAVKAEYDQLDTAEAKNLFLWSRVGNPANLFRNSAIGTLVTDLSNGVEVDAAVRMFESKVAPQNYKRTTALITQKMIDQAAEKLRELGLESAVERRFAKISDVSVNNVLFVDNAVQPQMKDGIAGLLTPTAPAAKADVKHAERISIDDFLARVVPQASSIQLQLEGKQLSQFMSLTAPVHADAGKLFRWDNGFAWSYDGDVADSIKQRVKSAGGKIDADVRVSLAWFNTDDLDLHVYEPRPGRHISFCSKTGPRMGGTLDVDMNVGNPVRNPVENIFWNGVMFDGEYQVEVNQFTRREDRDVGFTVEIEKYGEIMQLSYPNDVRTRQSINVATLRVEKGRLVDIVPAKGLIGRGVSQEKWGVKTETLVTVDTLLASPNHWDGQGVGNKHWFFILKDCRNPAPARGIYNEFLDGRLEPHRKVFEVLGSKTKCPVTDEQLSGVGFSSTRADEATVVVKGRSINKAFQIVF
jgi:desulfoferrodoxin (superoxide reductase-like protein)